MPFVNARDEVDPAFAELLVRLAAAYQTARLTDLGISVYARALGDLTLDEVRRACGQAVHDCAFFPSVAELRRFVLGTRDEAALLAWAGLTRAAAEVGGYQTLVVEDGCAAEALRAVWSGWPAFCAEEDGPALGQKRSEFLAAYRRAARRRLRGAGTPAILAGLCGENSRPGGARAAYWAARLTAAGQVVPEREAALLPAQPGRPALPEKGPDADPN